LLLVVVVMVVVVVVIFCTTPTLDFPPFRRGASAGASAAFSSFVYFTGIASSTDGGDLPSRTCTALSRSWCPNLVGGNHDGTSSSQFGCLCLSMGSTPLNQYNATRTNAAASSCSFILTTWISAGGQQVLEEHGMMISTCVASKHNKYYGW
jgi:hypothetical protein